MSVADKDEESVTKGDDVNEIVVTTISSSVVPSTSPSTLSSSIPLSQSSFSTDSPILTTESITETRDILADIPDIKITVMERMPEPDTEMQVISDEDIVPEEMQDDVMLEVEEVEFEDIQNAKNSISPINPTERVDNILNHDDTKIVGEDDHDIPTPDGELSNSPQITEAEGSPLPSSPVQNLIKSEAELKDTSMKLEVELEDPTMNVDKTPAIEGKDQDEIRKSRTVPSFEVVEESEDLAGKVSDGRTEAYKDILDSLEFELNPTAEVVETSHGVTVFVNEEISLNSEEIADDKR